MVLEDGVRDAAHGIPLVVTNFARSAHDEWMTAMADGEDRVAVTMWLARLAGRSTVELIRAFDAAMAALWQRAHQTLGESTLGVIVGRVLRTAAVEHPLLASIETTTPGRRCRNLETQAGLRRHDVAEAFRFVLVELLAVMGHLTGRILARALQAELTGSAGRSEPITPKPRAEQRALHMARR